MTFIRAPYIEAVIPAQPGKRPANDRSGGCAVPEAAAGDGGGQKEKSGIGAEILARVENRIVAVRFKNQIGISFHPELDEDDRIHEMFLRMCGKGV